LLQYIYYGLKILKGVNVLANFLALVFSVIGIFGIEKNKDTVDIWKGNDGYEVKEKWKDCLMYIPGR